jgi:hypothetical protein
MGATTGWLRLQMCVMRGGGRVQEIMWEMWISISGLYVRCARLLSRRAVPSSCDVLYSYVTHCLQFDSCVLCMRVITRRIFLPIPNK